MEHDGYSGVRIESLRFSSKPKLLCLGLSILAIFIVFLGIGAGGPNVWVYKDYNSPPQLMTDGGRSAYSTVTEITKANQIFYAQSRISRPTFQGYETDEDIRALLSLRLRVTTGKNDDPLVTDKIMDRHIICKSGQEFCSWFSVLTQDLIDTGSYKILVLVQTPPFWYIGDEGIPTIDPATLYFNTRVWYINSNYTKFMMGWKYLFVVLTLIVALVPRGGYVNGLVRAKRSTWSFQQKWILLLLVCLFFFNDPLSATRIYFNSHNANLGLSGFYIVCVLVFMAALLLWWLCLFSDMTLVTKNEQDGQTGVIRRTSVYWITKIVLVTAITGINMIAYFYYRYNKETTPEYSGLDDDKKANTIFAIILGLLMTVYILWLLVLILNGCRYVSKLSKGYIFLYVFTLSSLLVFVIGVFTAAFYPWSDSGVAFLGFHGLMNVYIWALAFAYMPVNIASDSSIHNNDINIGLSTWTNTTTNDTTSSKHNDNHDVNSLELNGFARTGTFI